MLVKVTVPNTDYGKKAVVLKPIDAENWLLSFENEGEKAYDRHEVTPIPADYSCETCFDLDETCQECCEHDYDTSEGYTCLNCGKEGDYGALIDALEYRFDTER